MGKKNKINSIMSPFYSKESTRILSDTSEKFQVTFPVVKAEEMPKCVDMEMYEQKPGPKSRALEHGKKIS